MWVAGRVTFTSILYREVSDLVAPDVVDPDYERVVDPDDERDLAALVAPDVELGLAAALVSPDEMLASLLLPSHPTKVLASLLLSLLPKVLPLVATRRASSRRYPTLN